jgi:hypothetical protein
MTEQISTRDLQMILLSAFRYSLGRTTYMSNVCVEWLIKWWDILPEDYKRQIHDDINHAIKFNMAGHECDVEQWKKLLEFKK